MKGSGSGLSGPQGSAFNSGLSTEPGFLLRIFRLGSGWLDAVKVTLPPDPHCSSSGFSTSTWRHLLAIGLWKRKSLVRAITVCMSCIALALYSTMTWSLAGFNLSIQFAKLALTFCYCGMTSMSQNSRASLNCMASVQTWTMALRGLDVSLGRESTMH